MDIIPVDQMEEDSYEKRPWRPGPKVLDLLSRWFVFLFCSIYIYIFMYINIYIYSYTYIYITIFIYITIYIFVYLYSELKLFCIFSVFSSHVHNGHSRQRGGWCADHRSLPALPHRLGPIHPWEPLVNIQKTIGISKFNTPSQGAVSTACLKQL